MKERNSLTIERLEEYWRDFILSFPWTMELDGAVVASYSKLPYHEPNHAGNINVDESAAAELLEKITKHFSVQGSPAVWFRVTPPTSPESFSSLLETNGFKIDLETSVMTFEGDRFGEIMGREVEIKEVSKDELMFGRPLCARFLGYRQLGEKGLIHMCRHT